MERFFFKKVELWFVLLLLLLAAIGAIVFGAAVRNEMLGHNRFGAFGKVAYQLASTPAELQDVLSAQEDNWMSVRDPHRFKGRAGWNFDQSTPEERPDGFVLLSRYDRSVERHVVELVDLKSGTTEHRLVTRPEEFFAGWTPEIENDIATAHIPKRFRAIHPYMLDNGDVLIKDHHSPLVRLSPCGDLVWRSKRGYYHHALERGPDGHFWLPDKLPLEADYKVNDSFSNVAIAQISADGEVLYSRSIGDVLLEHGHEHLVFEVSKNNDNPMHLNDVQPVFEDGPYWKRGDVFLSFRESSVVMQFRPETDEIIWLRQGPWRAQHDVDIVDDHTIAIFNNDVINTSGRAHVRDANKISYYDFETDSVSGPHDQALAEHEVKALFGGLFERLPGGFVMVEETSQGRLVVLDPEGQVVVEYVNRAEDGLVYFLGWTRYMSRADGARAVAAIRAADCQG
ncbi:arylsulfotransferase family protein [Fluviibacterium sp. DFM31]|uniref:Arylsulfotransferase family protein n=1 Tax=Meridianimarinicoccus marinus TaxID=3231483 RepID=A0ABV3L8C9_9RHOB